MRYTQSLKTGYGLLAAGDAASVVAQAERLVQARPDHVRGYFLLALGQHELDRSDQALATLRRTESLTESFLPLFLQSVIHYDLDQWHKAARTIGTARLLAHKDNFIVSGMERLILFKNNIDGVTLTPFMASPAIYNRFVGPRLLVYLASEIHKQREDLNLPETLWAKMTFEAPVFQPRTLKTLLPFLAFRLPFLLVLKILGRPTMPLAAEEAYLRCDLKRAKAILKGQGQSLPKNKPWPALLMEALAMLSLDMAEYRDCLKYLPEGAGNDDPASQFIKGFCHFHLDRFKESLKSFDRALAHPMAFFFKGLCHIASGDGRSARRAFSREIHRADINMAERILMGGQLLKIFPPKLDCGVSPWPAP